METLNKHLSKDLQRPKAIILYS